MRNFKNSVIMSSLAAGLIVAAVSGCQTSNDGRSAGRVVDDRKLASVIEDNLQSEPVYKFDHVDVKAFNGVVQLSGFVTSEEQKRRAGELAERTPGAAQIVNNITVAPNLAPTGRIHGDDARSYANTNSWQGGVGDGYNSQRTSGSSTNYYNNDRERDRDRDLNR